MMALSIFQIVLVGLMTRVVTAMYAPSAESIFHSHIYERGGDIKPEYDYIVVGGGTAGLTVADRLTESGKCMLPFCVSAVDEFNTDLLCRYRAGH